MNIEHLFGFKYRIPKEGKMRVDATFYASEGILKDIEAESYASLRQICGVAAFDPEEGGVVSPGGVGFDINCGVRLLVSELNREELDPKKSSLADALYESVPSGGGKGRKEVR